MGPSQGTHFPSPIETIPAKTRHSGAPRAGGRPVVQHYRHALELSMKTDPESHKRMTQRHKEGFEKKKAAAQKEKGLLIEATPR